MKWLLIALFCCDLAAAQAPLITDVPARRSVSLNGRWQYIVDPYETGFYDYRYKEMNRGDRNAYWNSDVPRNKTDKVEYGYVDKYSLTVPGDWNHQDPKFLYYEGTVWYKKSFDFHKAVAGDRVFLYFGAVNYRADVYLNGVKLGMHKGGFTPFDFEVPDTLLLPTGNFLVVRVDNKRYADEVPTLNTDWWNYGGITREVKLLEVPQVFVRDFDLHVSGSSILGCVRAPGASSVTVAIPELHLRETFQGDSALVRFSAPGLQLWSPSSPKLYKVIVRSDSDSVTDKIGFRTIVADGRRLFLNGKPIFLKGISVHGEIASGPRRAWSREDALHLLGLARELGCNMVRLAHYPHDETMTRMADSLGILVWSEIPVYWTIDFGNPDVYDKAEAQLREMITRDHNRASVIVWSVGNETPVSPVRTDFMRRLIATAHRMDSSRLVSAALEVNYSSGAKEHVVDDPLGQYVDLVAFNEYLGWYGGLPSACETASWRTIYDKPLFISETGAGALGGYHADSLTRWSEEYQAWYFREQVRMLHHMPDNFVGISPWVLVDFRSPKRNNPVYQDGWNNKGLVSHDGRKKKAFWVVKQYYGEIH